MRTGKQVHLLLSATPDLLFVFAELPLPGPDFYESLTIKEVEHRLDGLARSEDPALPEWVVEVQFYFDEWIDERIVREIYARRIAMGRHDVEGIVIFARRRLDPADHPARSLVKVVYLDEAVKKLAAHNPEHPAVLAFAPLLIEDAAEVAKHCGEWYRSIRTSTALSQAQCARYAEVFLSWLMQRLEMSNLEDLEMFIADLPDLEDTDFYRLVMQRDATRMLLRIGRHAWGAEPEGFAALVRHLHAPQLEELTELVLDLPSWEALRAKIPPNPKGEKQAAQGE